MADEILEVEIDDEIYRRAKPIVEELGYTMEEALVMFLRKLVEDGEMLLEGWEV